MRREEKREEVMSEKVPDHVRTGVPQSIQLKVKIGRMRRTLRARIAFEHKSASPLPFRQDRFLLSSDGTMERVLVFFARKFTYLS